MWFRIYASTPGTREWLRQINPLREDGDPDIGEFGTSHWLEWRLGLQEWIGDRDHTSEVYRVLSGRSTGDIRSLWDVAFCDAGEDKSVVEDPVAAALLGHFAVKILDRKGEHSKSAWASSAAERVASEVTLRTLSESEDSRQWPSEVQKTVDSYLGFFAQLRSEEEVVIRHT